jgi:hypothetical protein
MQVRRFSGPCSGLCGRDFLSRPLNLGPLRHNHNHILVELDPFPWNPENWTSTSNWRILDSNDILYPRRLPRVPTRLAGMRRGEVTPPIYRLAIQATM